MQPKFWYYKHEDTKNTKKKQMIRLRVRGARKDTKSPAKLNDRRS